MPTCDTPVRGNHVRLQLLQARSRVLELSVRDTDLADTSPGTASVGELKDVSIAADVAHVGLHTATNRHSTVACRHHHDDLVV